MAILQTLLAVFAIITFYSLLRSLFSGHKKLDKKRMEQLKFKKHSSKEMSTKEFIEKFTAPVRTYVLPNIKRLEDMSELEKGLEMSQWNKIFTPVTFVAMDLTLKILGIVLFGIIGSYSWQIGSIWFFALFFLFRILYNNSRKERRFRLLSQFPDFIRITQGFLMSNMPLSQSIENALPYVQDDWKPLLREFVINTEMYSQDECIEILSNRVDIFEVRELWSLIRLNEEQGIDIKESFNSQAEKVKDMQLEVMMNKIGKRQTMSIAIQGPLLLAMIVSFGLPTFASMVTLGF